MRKTIDMGRTDNGVNLSRGIDSPVARCVKRFYFSKAVIPACFKRWFDWLTTGEFRTGPPIKTFGGDAYGKILIVSF